jgi:hypothetical protein
VLQGEKYFPLKAFKFIKCFVLFTKTNIVASAVAHFAVAFENLCEAERIDCLRTGT